MPTAKAHNPRYVAPPREPAATRCEWPGCAGEGHYRAPKSRSALRDYHHFCLDHVRAYNASWNFFEGMSAAEIDAFRHEDLTGHRPTWRVGLKPSLAFVQGRRADPFGLFRGETAAEESAPRLSALPPEERRAWQALGFDRPVDAEALKGRFKELVKLNHPDANGGDRDAGDRLRVVIQAYRTLSRKDAVHGERA